MNDQAIKYHGRTMVDADGAWLDWSASGLELNVQGGCVRAKILAADSNDLNCVYMAVYINGNRTEKIRLSAGANWYTLADHLPSGSVTNVKLYKLNEAAMATATVKELEITGELKARTPDSARRIEWIGDSITAGYGMLAKQSDPFTSETEDALYTYAALASESLGADYHILAASGYGVATSNGGSTDSGLLPLVYPYTSFPRGTLEKYLWDYKRFEPDVIVVNLGTNDFAGASGSASGRDRLKTAIPVFLATLRKAHPGAVIVWAYGLMIDGYLNDIRASVERYAADDGNTYFIALPQQKAANGYGSGGHPNVASHLEAGGIMAAELEALMGWQ